jgi:hypothetical protein
MGNTHRLHIPGTLFCCAILVTIAALAGCQKHIARGMDSNKSTMRKLYEEDQRDFNNVDRARFREKVQQLMSNGKIQSGEDYYYAAFIFQHGLKPSDYLYAHVLAATAVDKGLHNAGWLSAATLDRYLQSIQQPQIFGTQFGSLFNNRDDQEPYDREMLSDPIRAMWCVAPKATQSKILADVKSGEPFISTRTCPLPDAQFDGH